MPKNIKYLIIHCTATPMGREVTKDEIIGWHKGKPPHGRGWSRVGYSDMIHLDGSVENLNSFNQDNIVQSDEMTWGVAGKNRVSRHVVYVGGCDNNLRPKDTRTVEQIDSMLTIVKMTILRVPNILVAGHNQFSNKDCPSFEVPRWLLVSGINEKNILNHSTIYGD